MNIDQLYQKVTSCRHCEGRIPSPIQPVLQISKTAKVLIAGQAPGAKVHASGIPFDDASGERLRDWMGITRDTFYDDRKIAILPMAFCYPGKGKSGDLPPPKDCAKLWREPALAALTNTQVTLIIGQYAQAWHLPSSKHESLTQTVKSWLDTPNARLVPLPHPSPRNNIWLKKNPWFELEFVPQLQQLIAQSLK